MTPEHWQRVEEIFRAALERPPGSRSGFLAEACPDANVRREVESLLHRRDDPIAGTPAWPISETLASGTRLGPYEILSQIGAGGMGTVHRARDTRVDRFVAIKICREHISGHFDREARAIAALNHPHICTLYDLGQQDGVDYLVMEYVEGETLAERLTKGPIPASQAIRYALAIADALAAAHARGIVHRDLKPGNIMVTKTGVKVLDFGLAKIQHVAAPSAGNGAATQTGTIAGTPQYMSPEQVHGKEVDTRSDIFSFGLVLYEMISGRRAFAGESNAAMMAAILEREPPPLEAGSLDRVVTACLAKDPGERLQTARDLKRMIEWSVAGSGPATPAPPRPRWWIPWAAAAILAALAFLVGLRVSPSEAALTRSVLTIVPPTSAPLPPVSDQSAIPEISPDGSSVMYRAAGGLWVRRLDSLQSELVRGSQGILNAPFWSADSKTVTFDTATGLYRVRVPDGAPEVITRLPAASRGGTWSDSGTILISDGGRLYAVPASGGDLRPVDMPGKKAGSYKYPQFLPGSQDFLLLFVHDDDEECEVYLATLRDGQAVNPTLLLKNDTAARYTPEGGGHILFVRNDNLYSQKLSAKSHKLEGDAVLIQQGVASVPGVQLASFSVSRAGVFAWRPGKAALNQVTTFDRSGKEIGKAGPPTAGATLSLSPDEKRLLTYGDGSWLLEPGQSGRRSLESRWGWSLWSPDGTRILGYGRRSGLVERAVSGAGEAHQLAAIGDGLHDPQDLSPDGRDVLIMRGISTVSLRLQGTEQEGVATPLTQSSEPIHGAGFSPDGRWIVYSQQQMPSGIFVQPFPGPGLSRQIANVRGRGFPLWRKDGREIVIFDGQGVWSVRVSGGGVGIRFGVPELLFSGLRRPVGYNAATRPLAVSRDGSRFYLPVPPKQPDSGVIHVGIGWVKP